MSSCSQLTLIYLYIYGALSLAFHSQLKQFMCQKNCLVSMNNYWQVKFPDIRRERNTQWTTYCGNLYDISSYVSFNEKIKIYDKSLKNPRSLKSGVHVWRWSIGSDSPNFKMCWLWRSPRIPIPGFRPRMYVRRWREVVTWTNQTEKNVELRIELSLNFWKKLMDIYYYY